MYEHLSHFDYTFEARNVRFRRTKRTILTSSGLGLLPMVSELDTERCASEDAGPQGGGLRDPMSVGEGNETFLVRV